MYQKPKKNGRLIQDAMKEYREKKMPVFGIGPVYVVSCLILTIMGLLADHYCALLESGEVPQFRIFMSITGILLILGGMALWIKSVLFQKITKEIKSGRLLTSGVYSIVRNPIYSAFLFIFTGALLLASNLYLLVLPLVFWAFLTGLMKCTEEKWLKDKFGEEYTAYCKKVNRVIPWFRKNKH